MQPFPLRGLGLVHAGAVSLGRDGFAGSRAGSRGLLGVAGGAGAAFATRGNGADWGEPAQLHADVGRGCLWGAEGRVLARDVAPRSALAASLPFLRAACPRSAVIPAGAARPRLLSRLLLLR